MLATDIIVREIGHTKHGTVPPRRCVSCGKQQSTIDIATQAIQEPHAGMHCCQTCMAIDPDDLIETF